MWPAKVNIQQFKTKNIYTFYYFCRRFALLVTNPATQINTDPANPDPNAKPWQSHLFLFVTAWRNSSKENKRN
jgi:hypothetical protein